MGRISSALSEKKAFDMALIERTKEPPKLSLRKAMDIAEAHIENEKIDVSQYYLTQVKLVYADKGVKKPFWWFWWVKTDLVIGNYVEIAVSMDGKARRLPSM